MSVKSTIDILPFSLKMPSYGGAMMINLTTRHLELPERVKELIAKKERKFEKFKDKIIKIELVLSRESTNFTAEGKIDLKYGLLTAKGKNPDLGLVASKVLEKLLTQLKKEDERIKKKWRTAKRLQ